MRGGVAGRSERLCVVCRREGQRFDKKLQRAVVLFLTLLYSSKHAESEVCRLLPFICAKFPRHEYVRALVCTGLASSQPSLASPPPPNQRENSAFFSADLSLV